ncbi:MAG: sigma-70 family RNA polymerase sigma factor [Deltaproteobacteria bacterium]|nr:sigma-70 family RNA polymerase sigma factor [Deltaproteobacteria bacterium]
MDESSDEALMQAYASGDARSFQTLFTRYEKRLRSFFFRRLSGARQNAVEDLFQITWLKIHQARKKFDSEQRFGSWAFTIAVNTIRDHVREARWKYESVSDHLEETASTDESSQSVLQWVDRQFLEEALKKLQDGPREILILSDIEGFSSSEIAKMKNKSDSAVRQILVRARLRLKEFAKLNQGESKKNHG